MFERFVSPERNEPPDIDVDFEHERREEVIQYIYQRYGRDRAGSGGRRDDLSRAFGDPRDGQGVRPLGRFPRGANEPPGQASTPTGEDRARSAGLDLADPTLAPALKLAEELAGFPRHLTQHTGGFVITRERLDEVVPVMNAAMDGRTTIEWDKDDLDALGILKVDVLALGMLTALRKGLDLLAAHYGVRRRSRPFRPKIRTSTRWFARRHDRRVPDRKPRANVDAAAPEAGGFYDLVIEVAIVRPGPIQGDMVHPYLRRRRA